ncbi:uncharacterized protein G2W53_004377 [Senna tora]|uniref:Uncharacterized protein n=1 Tax=Senna tora TaxID=362788 RepID=A0A834XBR3_9FABA|nr:uncharacterized protein G2W53_004377 [Senna tora]
MELVIAWKRVKTIASRYIWEFEWIQISNGARDRMEGGFNAQKGSRLHGRHVKSSLNTFLNSKSQLNLKRTLEVKVYTCCCTSETKQSLPVVYGNSSGCNARMRLVITWKVSQDDLFALYLRIPVDLMLE